MSIIYSTDIGTVISMDTGQVITGATALTLEVKKPSGAIASWTATIGADTTSLQHTITTGELDETGTYLLQAKLTLGGGTWRGATDNLEVRGIFK